MAEASYRVGVHPESMEALVPLQKEVGSVAAAPESFELGF